jgi:hypothetical protein
MLLAGPLNLRNVWWYNRLLVRIGDCGEIALIGGRIREL